MSAEVAVLNTEQELVEERNPWPPLDPTTQDACSVTTPGGYVLRMTGMTLEDSSFHVLAPRGNDVWFVPPDGTHGTRLVVHGAGRDIDQAFSTPVLTFYLADKTRITCFLHDEDGKPNRKGYITRVEVFTTGPSHLVFQRPTNKGPQGEPEFGMDPWPYGAPKLHINNLLDLADAENLVADTQVGTAFNMDPVGNLKVVDDPHMRELVHEAEQSLNQSSSTFARPLVPSPSPSPSEIPWWKIPKGGLPSPAPERKFSCASGVVLDAGGLVGKVFVDRNDRVHERYNEADFVVAWNLEGDYRVVRPGDFATTDVRRDRLTLELDGQGRIQNAYCG
eukprot:TRINITY_DN33118_c0_g1_i1.p1 TRINITY_DN33118_c0_g1~~TRINITY_DN33118_c0_g1_i1.p1  ORF type:complete len:357 (-),score=66.88 TRINITY_DN33118_c0_g1_i1:469-1470(-)